MRHTRVIIPAILAAFFFLSIPMTSRVRAGDFFETEKKGFRFSPAPGSVCTGFLITETSILYRIKRADSKPSIYDLGQSPANSYMMIWQVGYMSNTSEHDAWGGAFNIGYGDHRYRIGLGPAYRRWFRHRSFFDASAGVLVAGKEDEFHIYDFCPYAQVGLGLSSVFSAVLRVEHLTFRDNILYQEGVAPWGDWSATFYHFGITVGGEPGAVFCGISGAVAVLALVILHSEKTSPVWY